MSQAGVPPGQGNPPGYGHSPSPATPQGPAGGTAGGPGVGPGAAGGQKGGTLPMSAVPELMGLMPNQPGAANYGAPPNQPAPANYGAQNYAPQNYAPPNQPAPANYGAQNYGYAPGPGAPGPNQIAPGYAPDPRLNRAAPVVTPQAAAPTKRSSLGLILALGAIGVIALIAAGAGAYWYRQRAVSLERQLIEAAAARNSIAQNGIQAAALEGDCKKAYDCCVAITSKADARALLAQCEVLKLAGRQPSECTTALIGYRKVATSNGLNCD